MAATAFTTIANVRPAKLSVPASTRRSAISNFQKCPMWAREISSSSAISLSSSSFVSPLPASSPTQTRFASCVRSALQRLRPPFLGRVLVNPGDLLPLGDKANSTSGQGDGLLIL